MLNTQCYSIAGHPIAISGGKELEIIENIPANFDDNYEKLIKYLITGIDDGIPISSKNNIDHAMKTR
mgnify:CR=1 FL=1